MNILTIIILAFIFALILFLFNKHRHINRNISLLDSGFGKMRVGSMFSFIDETVYPVIRIGYIKNIEEDGTILIYTPSLDKTVRIYRRGENYFLIGPVIQV